MDFDQAVNKLEEYAEYEGSEAGEYWMSLLHLWRYRYMFGDSPFENELKKEIVEQAEFIDENYKFVEEKVTHTSTVKRLEWIGD